MAGVFVSYLVVSIARVVVAAEYVVMTVIECDATCSTWNRRKTSCPLYTHAGCYIIGPAVIDHVRTCSV